MIDTFKVTLVIPSPSSLFRNGSMVTRTPTGSVEVEPILPKVWRDLDNEVAVRNYAEHRLIKSFPARKTMWHGSHIEYFNIDVETGSIVAIVDVDSDHFDGASKFASMDSNRAT